MTQTENLLQTIRMLSKYVNNPTAENSKLCCDPITECLRDAIPYYDEIGVDPPYCDICRRNYQGDCCYGEHAYKSKDVELPFRNGCSRAILQWCVDRLLTLFECDLDRYDKAFSDRMSWTWAELVAFKQEEEQRPKLPFPNK